MALITPPGRDETTNTFPTSCSCADLFANAASNSLRDPGMSAPTRLAIRIIVLNSIIAGLNNSEVFTQAELEALGKCCDCTAYSELDRDAMWTYILWALAQNVGTISETPAALIDEAIHLAQDPRMLRAMELSLLCQFMQAVNTLANTQ